MLKNIVFFFLLCLLIGCKMTPQEEILVGSWTGDHYYDARGTSIAWLMKHYADYSYDIYFTEYRDGEEIYKKMESGVWDAKNGLYRTDTLVIQDVYKTSDIEPGTYLEVYRIINLNDNYIKYQDTVTGMIFEGRKVSKNIRF